MTEDYQMTQDEIVKMAREAGFRVGPSRDGPDDVWGIGVNLERFAALVAAAERERLAAKFMEMHNAQQHRNNYFAFAARVIKEEK